MAKITNLPRCHNHSKCGNMALTLIGGMWICGPCCIFLQKKLNKIKERLLLGEVEDVI